MVIPALKMDIGTSDPETYIINAIAERGGNQDM